MKVKYDKDVDILYIHLSDEKIKESDEEKPGIISIIIKRDIIGIEVMHASKKMPQPIKFEYEVAS